MQIWKNNLKRIIKDFEAQNKTIEIEKKEIIKFAKGHSKELKSKGLLNWNGRYNLLSNSHYSYPFAIVLRRQIRNVFQTAVTLAAFDARRNKRPDDLMLGKQHFMRVAETSEEFDRYLLSLSQGKNDSQLTQ